MKKYTSFMLALLLVLSISTVRADQSTVNQEVILDLAGNEKSDSVTINHDTTTNLLVSNEKGFLEEVEDNGRKYELDSVKITRDRIKMTVEYYEGDYNNSTLIGSDWGYVDYNDTVSLYVLEDINAINNKFGANVPSNYKLIRVDGGAYRVPSYEDTNGEIVVKILLAEVKRYSISSTTYQNKQNISFPDYLGKTESEINDASSEFWMVSGYSVRVDAVVGQSLKLKSYGNNKDSQIISGRQSELRSIATPNRDTGILEEAPEYWTIDENSTSYKLDWFYEVDDLGSPLKKPGYSSSTTTKAVVSFRGKFSYWKTPQVSETLILSDLDQKNKLLDYPFNTNIDPFDVPEYDINYAPDNWILFHNLTFEYTYRDVTPPVITYNVIFNSQGGSFVPGIENIIEGDLIMKPSNPTQDGYKFLGWTLDPNAKTLWNFERDGVYSDITLYALWEEETKVPGDNNTNKPEDKPTVTPKSDDKLPQTGIESLSALPMMVILMGAALVVIERMRKNSNY